MDYYEDEQEIDLLDLLFYVLEKWRILLIAALIGLVVYGGYKFIGYESSRHENEELIAQGLTDEVIYSDSYQDALDALNDKQKEIRENETKIAELKADISEYENTIANCQDTITTCENQKILYQETEDDVNRKLSELQTYMDNSVILRIDVSSCPTATKVYQVVYGGSTQSLYRDPVDEILAAYTSGITLIGAGTNLSQTYDVEEKYLDELYEVGYDGTSNYISIVAFGENKSMAIDIRDAVCALLESRQESISQQFYDHTLVLVDEFYSETSNVIGNTSMTGGVASVNTQNVAVSADGDSRSTLATTQNNLYSMLNDYRSQIVSLENSIATADTKINNANSTISSSEAQVLAANNEIATLQNEVTKLNKEIISEDLEGAVEAKAPSFTRSLKDAIKKGLIAALIVGLVGCIYYAAVYVLDGKIHTATDLPITPMRPLLAVFNRPKGENLNFIDQWIYEHRNRNWITPNEEIMKTAAVTLEKLLDGKTRVAILSTMKENDTEQVTEGLKALLPSLEFICIEDSIRSSDSAEQLTRAEAAILFETREQSKLAQVIAELSQTTLLDMPVVGFLVS